jgi:chorismate synthase
MSNGKGPKIKPRGGKTKTRIKKLNSGGEGRLDTKDLIQSLNAVKGVEISKGVSASVLKGVANKIANVIPVAGVAGKKNKD